MKIISSILFLVLLQSFTVAQAQYVVNKGFVEDALRARVKLVDEFMRRFNCQKLLPGLDTTNQDYKQLNLLSLFDSEMFGVKESDSLYFQARQLVADALENDVTLSYSDTSLHFQYLLHILPCLCLSELISYFLAYPQNH